MTAASVVIPTRARPAYLEVALGSIVPQAGACGAEVIVVDDAGESAEMRALVERGGARYEPHPRPLGLNAARNTGVERSGGELIVFVDDDIRARPGWLAALLEAARRHPEIDVFTGPVSARLEGPAPHSCGREAPPVTTLELGDEDTPTQLAWGANMAIRRDAFALVGPFDVSLEHGGDEQEWQERLARRRPGTSALYVARAGVEHRRAGSDARLRSLCATAYTRGRAARRFDSRRGIAPSMAGELRTLAGCVGHVLRRACPAGLVMVAHSAGRIREALAHTLARLMPREAGERVSPAGARNGAAASASPQAADDFLSGESGSVGGLDGVARAVVDASVDSLELLTARRMRLRAAARRAPVRSVLALSVQRPEHAASSAAIARELGRSRHQVELHCCGAGDGGKFENLDRMLERHPADGHDWLLVIDDDVKLPHGFLDPFVFLCERFSLALAQPAHRLRSHAAWPVTRRRPGSVVRETGFVEIGPVSAFAASTFPVLLPFPRLRMGWGLDAHWAAVARARGWRCGVVDAVAIEHMASPVASTYGREAALAEAREFLSQQPYLPAREAARTLATHRHW
ncbi:MAG TPA: glycosyltransferase [Solirubrobacteraceae bacterium]|nr:glycosyltransferase [Solirubrobacteraceae bacterium]